MRAIWKGFIRFSLVSIPIKLYSAIESSKTISFRQLHKEDNGPIGYQKTCKVCDEKVSNTDIVKGYEYEPGQYVIVEAEDIQNIRLKSTKVIEIEAFVDAEEVHHTLFESPYYAGPDGEVAASTYGLLSETLKRTNKLGIGRVVLRDREHVVLIAPHGPGILMYKLRYPNELRAVDKIPQLATEVNVEDSQVQLAETLVQTMTKAFGDLELKDRYKEALVEMIQDKIAGKQTVTLAEETEPVVDIMTALKESIELAKSAKKPMKRAAGKAAEEVDEVEERKSKSA